MILETIQTLTMNSTQASNTEHNKNERPSLSFSFSPEESKVSTEDLVRKVQTSLQSILNDRHSHWEKREIHPKHGRLNFACPYCGDSTNDTRKKRGNIYTDGLYFKCYNCGKYRSIQGFLRDFKVEMSADEIVLAREVQRKAISVNKTLDPMLFLDKDSLIRYGIDREDIEFKHKLVPLDRSKIFVYLKKRLQPDMSRFSWNEERQQLYIFHLIPGTTRVLGYQIRNFRSQPKYLTFKLSKIYEELGREVPEEVYEIDDISTTFGILELDLTQPVTVFEGPLDSFLYKNSAATCSSNIDFPIPLGNVRYMFDYDKAGKEAAMKKVSEGRPVFLWKKLLSDTGITEPLKKMDLTEYLVYCKRKGIKIPRLSNYFSQDKYDVYYI
jgi:predicted RNA-binding Zn-ribbon protein involved in translation (DUF1610 family)